METETSFLFVKNKKWKQKQVSISNKTKNGWTGGWAYKGEAVLVEVPVGVGDEPPEVLDAVGAIVRDLEEGGHKGVIDANKIVVSGLSYNREEGQCGGSEGYGKGGGCHGSGMGGVG